LDRKDEIEDLFELDWARRQAITRQLLLWWSRKKDTGDNS